MSPGRFCRIWLIALVALMATIGLFNAAVDPYLVFGMPRIAGFNAKKPDASAHVMMAKTYEVERYAR